MKINRKAIIQRILPRAKYLGVLETTEGELHILTYKRLVLGGGACNVGLLLDGVTTFERWECPVERYVEEFDVQLWDGGAK
jgi:hypothetical protein